MLHSVDGYGFGMVVDVIENSIFSDAETISFDTFELFGFMLPRLVRRVT